MQRMAQRLQEQNKAMQEKEAQLASVVARRDAALAKLRESAPSGRVQKARAELEAVHAGHAIEIRRLKAQLVSEREVESTFLHHLSTEKPSPADAGHCRGHRARGDVEADGQPASSERCNFQVWRLREALAPLRQECQQAAEAARQARQRQCLDPCVERDLAEAQLGHQQRRDELAQVESQLRSETRRLREDLRAQEQELRDCDQTLKQRDRSLEESGQQLADMQALFEQVNQQLRGECERIEQLHSSVGHCASQSAELENLRGMVRESHQTLISMRDALHDVRADRAKTSRLLGQEQHRTWMLLDVLKHFKEKLQDLSPELLRRLGMPDLAKGDTNSPTNSPRPMSTVASLPSVTFHNGSPRLSSNESAVSSIIPEASSVGMWLGSRPGLLGHDAQSPSMEGSRPLERLERLHSQVLVGPAELGRASPRLVFAG